MKCLNTASKEIQQIYQDKFTSYATRYQINLILKWVTNYFFHLKGFFKLKLFSYFGKNITNAKHAQKQHSCH